MSETSFQPFLGKEWLVKINPGSSTPYLFVSAAHYPVIPEYQSRTLRDVFCCQMPMFTEIRLIHYRSDMLCGIHGYQISLEGSQQIARRWRKCNPQALSSFTTPEHEDEWRTSILELLAKAHTIAGVNASTFEVVHTDYSDMAFSLESTSFSWTWETCFVGHKHSADTISKQLVLPLISTNHLLFTSAEPVQDMTDVEVEKAVDKIGRTARRSVDTHIKNALSKPRVSTILRRITAILNSIHELPHIISSADESNLQVPSTVSLKPSESDFMSAKHKHDSLFTRDAKMSEPPQTQRPPSPMRVSPPQNLSPAKTGSSTEGSEDEGQPTGLPVPSTIPSQFQASPSRSASSRSPPIKPNASARVGSKSPLAEASHSKSAYTRASEQTHGNDKTSDDSSSPVRPPLKKVRAAASSSSESDSETERKARVAQLKGNIGMGGGAAKRDVRQPIKRGGKRF